jgi:peptidoglycan/LPS O-acetylase OafA/YrhL
MYPWWQQLDTLPTLPKDDSPSEQRRKDIPSAKKIGHRPDIDGLRALAVLSVLIYHLDKSWLPGGYTGVDVFFVISGFVVTGSLVGSNRPAFLAFINEFYARRLARILPALVAVLVASAFAATLFIPHAWLSAFSESTAKYAFFGLSNWALQNNADTYFAPQAELNPYTHTWSLGVEEQFYLIVPVLIFFWVHAMSRSRETGTRFAIGLLASLTAASLIACILTNRSQPLVAFYFIGCRFWELGIGVLLYLVTSRKTDTPWTLRHPRLRQYTAWLGLAFLVISFCLVFPIFFPWPGALFPTLGTALIIAGAQADPKETWIGRMLGSRPFVWVGLRSYSLYLWHWPVYILLRWTVGLKTYPIIAIAAITTTALAMFSYRWIELPLRHNRYIEKQPKWVRILGFLLLPVAGWLIATQVFENRKSVSLSTVVRNSTDWYVDTRMPFPDVGERQCEVKIQKSVIAGGEELLYTPGSCSRGSQQIKFHVIGDSHARMFAPIFEQLSAELGVEASVYSRQGCSFIDFRKPMASMSPDPGCLEFSRVVADRVLSTASPGDFVALPSLRLERYADQWGRPRQRNMYEVMYNPTTSKQREAAFLDAAEWLAPFAEKQLNVVFVAPTPIFKAPPFRCADWFNRNNPICIGHNQQSRAELEALRAPVMDGMAALSRKFSNVTVWDPFPILCPEATCYAFKSDRPQFFDGDHLSAYGDSLLYPDFKKMFTQAVFNPAISSINEGSPQ